MPRPKVPQPARRRRVFTVAPQASGATVPQTVLPNATLVPIPASPLPPGDFPRQGYADWSMEGFKETQLKNWSNYRCVDLLVWALFSEQAYYGWDLTYPLMRQAFPTVAFTRYQNLGSTPLGWDEVYLEGNRVLVFPGTEDLLELVSYVGFAMGVLPSQSADLLYYSGLGSTLQAYEDAIWAQYSEGFHGGEASTFFCGHSLGGILANYLAYRINFRCGSSPTQRGPVYSCFTFGAPAAWVDRHNATTFTANHYHVRAIALGDPVPGLVQVAVQNSPIPAFRVSPDYVLPLHYDSRSVSLNSPGKMEALQRAVAEPAYKAIRNSYPALRDAATAHGAANYVSESLRACRQERDTPFPLTSALIAWAQALSKGNLPRRT